MQSSSRPTSARSTPRRKWHSSVRQPSCVPPPDWSRRKRILDPRRRDVVAADVGHLQNIGSSLEPLPTSSALRADAVRLNDKELNEESGFPKLLEFLGDKVLAADKNQMQEMVMTEIGSAAGHLMLSMRSELSILRDPELRKGIVAELERAKSEAKELAGRTALWQQVLGDGIADLSAGLGFRPAQQISELDQRVRAGDRRMRSGDDLGGPGWRDCRTRSARRRRQLRLDSPAIGRAAEPSPNRSQQLVTRRSRLALASCRFRDRAGRQPGRSGTVAVRDGEQSHDRDAGIVRRNDDVRHDLDPEGMTTAKPFSVLAGVMLGRKTFTDDRDARLTLQARCRQKWPCAGLSTMFFV